MKEYKVMTKYVQDLEADLNALAYMGWRLGSAIPARHEDGVVIILERTKMSVWTHHMCWSCWAAKNGDSEPARLAFPAFEICCYCGIETRSGIAVRDNENNTPHCRDKGKPYEG